MKTKICHLQIIPIKNILHHETYDLSRAKPLATRLKRENYLANPVIVAALGKDKYLQLDGMNRLFSFKMLGFQSIAAQIVDYNDQASVELSSWTHLFHCDEDKLLSRLKNTKDLIIKEDKMEHVGHRYIKEEGLGRLCTLISRKKKVFLVSTNGHLLQKIGRLNMIVDLYKDGIVRDVLPENINSSDIEFLFAEHPEANFMVVFPTFTRHQIIDVVKKGGLFPPGVTRHIIKRRCLSVDAPISIFKSKMTITGQNEVLDKYLSRRKYRVYEEPTIYFE